VAPELHRRLGDHRVRVVGRRDHHGVEVALPLQHFPEVGVPGGAGELLLQPEPVRPRLAVAVLAAARELSLHVAEVHVAEGDEVLAHQRLGVAHAHPAGADDAHVERVAGGGSAAAEDAAGDHHGAEGDPAGAGDEVAAGERASRHGGALEEGVTAGPRPRRGFPDP
jgi:hypothetical protein